jgi:(3S)-malyl-CoA thioesterase
MDLATRPWRSVLYIPGSKERALEKARTLPTDAIIFDLEDAVAPEEKAAARATLAAALTEGGYGPRAQMVRINALDTIWGEADVAAIAATGPQAILLPKVNGPGDVARLARLLDGQPRAAGTRIWAMMETPLGILNATAIAAAPRMAGFVMGTNDLAKDIGAAGRAQLSASLQLCLLAARAHGLVAVDGVYNAFRDIAGLRAECEDGKALGFDGKSLIHPDQIAIANEVFAPTEDDLTLARRQITAYEAALAAGQGVAVLEGRIVENLHVATARATLAKAEAIATLAGAA